jgi:hypothetical protein
VGIILREATNSKEPGQSARAFVPAYVSIRQHTSYLHTTAYVSILERARTECPSVRTCIRQHTSAYVSIRQHTTAYVSIWTECLSVRTCRRCLVRPTGGAGYGTMYVCMYVYVYVCSVRTGRRCLVRPTGGAGYGTICARSCTRQHTPAYASIRQHTPAYASIRQHTSAYVSIRTECLSVRTWARSCTRVRGTGSLGFRV